MIALSKNTIAAVALIISAAYAHYANMGLDGVSCYIYNGIAGTTEGHMIVRYQNKTWIDHDDESNHGTITVVHSQSEYDNLQTKTKIGIVCVPDDLQGALIGVPYVEMEPTDEEFYNCNQTIYQPSLDKRFTFRCIIEFCRGAN